jgi:hypothetical protein
MFPTDPLRFIRSKPPDDVRLYIVQSSRATKLWFVLHGKKPVFPRIKQIGSIVMCSILDHDWSFWQCDDEDGPCESFYEMGEVVEIPLTTRKCKPDEEGGRVCHSCSLVQRRYPVSKLDPDQSVWPRGDLVALEDI